MIASRLAVRNLTRNRWRSGLTLAAIAVSVALMVWTLAFYEGWMAQMVRGATAVETGQLQIHTAAYADRERVYRAFDLSAGLLDSLVAVPGVVAASPRIEAHGLIGNEDRSQVARILGVDPVRETTTTPVADGIVAGAWLPAVSPPYPAPRPVVIGEGLAKQLRVDPGAELVVFLEASDGSLGNDLLEVVGIVRTGNTRVDRMSVYMHLGDAEVVTALEGRVHEIAVRTEDLNAARLTAGEVAGTLGALSQAPEAASEARDDRLLVRPWQAIEPAIDQMMLLFRRSYWFLYLFIYMVAGVGVLNTQRMSALERRREFGVMLAVGMRPKRMFRTLAVETGIMGLVGAVIGAVFGGALAWVHATRGLDISRFTGDTGFSYMGVAFTDRIYFQLTAMGILVPVVVMALFAVICGLWPAVRAARTDPVPAISGRAG